MKKLLYLSTLLLGLLTMSCSKNTEGIHASIVGIWRYSSEAVYSDGNLVPSASDTESDGMKRIAFEFQEGGTLIISGFVIAITGGYTFDKKTGTLNISITYFDGEVDETSIHVQKLTKSEMVFVNTENTDKYYKDGEWLYEENGEEKHSLKTELTFTRQ